jgi:ACS family hexuronate transporter-like MFS transporter
LAQNRLRWFFIAWITVSTILNYLDRQTLSIVAPALRDRFHLTNEDYSHIVSAFLVSYTVMYTAGGRFVDFVGERVGMATSIIWWSIATMLHSLATGAFSLGVFRCLLGIGEPCNYPAALKTASAWFPKRERGLPIAIYSSGSAVGAIFAPPLVAWITIHYGWRYGFLFPAASGCCGCTSGCEPIGRRAWNRLDPLQSGGQLPGSVRGGSCSPIATSLR